MLEIQIIQFVSLEKLENQKDFAERFGMSYFHTYFYVKARLSPSKKIELFALLKAI